LATKTLQVLLSVCLFLLLGSGTAAPQDSPSVDENKTSDSVSRLNKGLFKHILEDQRNIWLSPLHVKPKDAEWLVPLAGITTGLILTDRITQPELSRNHVNTANSLSNYGLAAYGGGVAAFYLLGRRDGSPKAQETAILAGEAGVNSLIVAEGLKYVFQRDRPNQGDGSGRFFQSGGGSFYSGHSTVVWSFATVIAQEYPGWMTKALAYGAASTISLARVAADQHFPSDVFVAAVTGYLIGRQVYRNRHDPDIEASFGTFVNQHPEWSSSNAGSTYVPLDSWIYPALERLFAAGYIRSQFLGLRPWTRTAASDMLSEAEQRMSQDDRVSTELQSVYSSLRLEFADEARLGADFDNNAIRLESVYSRSMEIAGQPINDSYHFGQTIINDYGRPYQQGFNQVVGFSARAEQGRFSYYFRGEYQHAPGAPAYSLPVRQVIAQADNNPVQPGVPVPETNTFRVLDGYAGVTLSSNFISVGKQSIWWSPDQGSAMIMGNNSVPFYMARINRVTPFKFPWIFKYLGPFRYDAYFGQLVNHAFPPRVYMHGEKISLKPTENLELGFSRTAVFAGQGVSPLTFGVFWRSLTSATSSTNPGADPRLSPGARHGQFDFSYRVPWLRKWVTVYSDGLVHDDISPIDAPRRAAWSPGVYVSHFPKLPKLDLRVEATNTDPPITNSVGGKFFYWEGVYHDLYINGGYNQPTSRGTLMGNWIGREGKGVQAWSTYWLSPMSTIQVGYRHAKVAKDFIPEGETINDYSIQAKIRVKPEIELSTVLQYETWNIPVLAPGPESNFTTSIQLTFWPKNLKLSSRQPH
jgi:hypothetical protein